MQANRFAADPKPVNLLASSEPLLLRDWLDEARQALHAAGFEDVQNLQVEAGFDWNELLQEGDMLSLFSTRKCRIVNLPTGKPGTEGSRIIRQLCESADDSCVYLFVVPALDRQSRNSSWCKAIGVSGRIIELKPIDEENLADWLIGRASAKGLSIDVQSARFLAERTEGNLLAADQELEKLAIRFGSETLDFAAVEDSVAQSSRYNHFLLVDACLAGNGRRAFRILRSLEAEGYVTVQLRWALQRALQQLDQLQQARGDGSLDRRSWQQLGIWRDDQRRLYQAALGRIDTAQVERLLQSCATLDRLGKGQQDSEYPGQDWKQLESLVAAFSSNELAI